MAQRHSYTIAVKPLTARSFAQQGVLLAVYDGCIAKVALCGGLSCLCLLRWHDIYIFLVVSRLAIDTLFVIIALQTGPSSLRVKLFEVAALII